MAVWLALLNEDHRGAGTLSAILIRADALAIQRYLNEFMSKINAKRSLYGGTGAFIDAPQESLLEKEQALGIEFIQWLAKSLEEGRFSLDQGLIVAVSGSLFLTKELFQIFMKDTHRTNWQALQNGFLALGMYVKDGQGKAILRIEQSQDKEMLSGVGFAKYGLALPDHIKTKTGEMLSAETLIHSIEQRSTQSSQKALEIKQLPKISAQGAWQFSPVTTNSTEAREPSSPRPGVRQGG